MSSNLVQLRAAVRQELRDEEAGSYVWPDAVIDRHVQDALVQLQVLAPAISSMAFPVPAGNPTRWSPAYPAGYLWTEAVECPLDERPQRFVPFREEGLQGAPSIYPTGRAVIPSGTTVRLYYAHAFSLTLGSGNQPVQLEPAIVLGATYFACRDQAIDLAPKLVGAGTVSAYREMVDRLGNEWERELARANARGGGLMWRVEW